MREEREAENVANDTSKTKTKKNISHQTSEIQSDVSTTKRASVSGKPKQQTTNNTRNGKQEVEHCNENHKNFDYKRLILFEKYLFNGQILEKGAAPRDTFYHKVWHRVTVAMTKIIVNHHLASTPIGSIDTTNQQSFN